MVALDTPAPVSGAPWLIAGSSVRGAAHRREDLPNQDAFAMWSGADHGASPRAIIAVSDGHGGARHFRSARGARLAVETSISRVRDLFEQIAISGARDPLESLIRDALPLRIVAAWRAAVEEDIAADAITVAELAKVEALDGAALRATVEGDPLIAYGATLLVAIAFEGALAMLQLGDGDVLCVDRSGRTRRPLPADERLVGNLTTSLCQPDASENFRLAVLRTSVDLPELVLLSTDGYANSFKSDADFRKVGKDYLDMLQRDGLAQVQRELPGILEHASSNGSGDDVTVGILARARPARGNVVNDSLTWSGMDQASGTPLSPAALEVAALRTQVEGLERKSLTLKRSLAVIAAVAGIGAATWVGWYQSRSGPDARPKATAIGQQPTTVIGSGGIGAAPPKDGAVTSGNITAESK